MGKSVTVACNTGNDTIKVKVNNNVYYVASLLKNNPRPRLILGCDEGDPVNFLDVTVDINDITGNYHVGELASFCENQESLGGPKSANRMLIVCMMSAIAYALSVEFPSETSFSITLGTGLPVYEFFCQNEKGMYDFSKVADYKTRLTGRHKVKFNTSLLNNKTIAIEISQENITIIPEGYAALSSILLGPDIEANFVQYTRKNILAFCLDIGSKSCDISAIMNSKYFPAGMFGFDIGMSTALDSLSLDLRNKTDIRDITRLEINEYLFDKDLKGIFKAGKHEINLNEGKIPHYRELANTITYRFKEKLKANGVDIHRISVLFLVGGGSLEIGDMIIDILKNDIPEFIGFDGEDAIIKNLLGYEMATKGLGKIKMDD